MTTHIFTHAGMDRSLLEKGGWVMHVCSILLEQKDGTEQSVGSFPRSYKGPTRLGQGSK